MNTCNEAIDGCIDVSGFAVDVAESRNQRATFDLHLVGQHDIRMRLPGRLSVVNMAMRIDIESMIQHRLPPTAVRMNHERLPRHCVYRAMSSMTSRYQIWHILNIAASFSATLVVKSSITSREIF
jgi:hypothetical protein